jgi:hypothetical protein
VRSATADPQTTGHAMSGPSSRGANRKDCATIFSNPDPARSKSFPRLIRHCIQPDRTTDFSIPVTKAGAVCR